MMKKNNYFDTLLYDTLVHLSAQSIILLCPSGKIYKKTGDIPTLDYESAGILLAQVMLAFQHLIAEDKNAQIFFAYQNNYYHYVGTGTYKQPFLLSIYNTNIHRPPLLGTIKYYIQQAYANIENQENLPRTDKIPFPAIPEMSPIIQHYIGDMGINDTKIEKALDNITQELNAQMVLAIDETGAIVARNGNINTVDVAHIGALAANSMLAFAEINYLSTRPSASAKDDLAMVIIEGPRAAVLIARSAGPYTFLIVLPPKGMLGMGRLLMKNLMQQEWTSIQPQWQEDEALIELDDDALTQFWEN